MPPDSSPVVLYVDDEPVNLRVFEANFRHHFKVLLAQSGKEALQKVEQHPEGIAVVISDQRMPEMTGVDFLEKVRELSPDTVRMLITAYSDMQAVVDAVNRGQVSRYFVKPWAKEELLNAVADAARIFTLQNRLRDIELRMMKSERLATLGQFSASVAHELLNPLSYIGQNVEMLRTEFGTICNYTAPLLQKQPDATVAQSVEDIPAILGDIEHGAKHLQKVGDRLKAQARGDDGDASCDIHDVAHFAEKITRSEVRRFARVTLTGSSALVGMSEVNLTQVLLNLIVNAAHAMEGLGRMGVIELRWRTEETTVALEVEDNGSGIKAENLPKIFEPLFTTKKPGMGTGLGLATCRELVRSCGGEISVQSREGKGTTFRLVLPRKRG
ncbi:MAG: ATP-binding protein [Myxococcaceae bacterium]